MPCLEKMVHAPDIDAEQMWCVQNQHRSSLKVRKPPGGDSSIVFGDPMEHISLKYRTSDEPPKIIG